MVSLFDQMASEYGWTDSQILDLPVCRLRSITEAIAGRKKAEMQASAVLVEWSTKVISTFVAATVPTPKGKKNPLLKSASEISLGLFDSKDSAASKKLPPSDDLKSLTPDQIDAIVNRPSAAEVDPASVATGRTEAFQLQFGRHLGGPR